MLPLWNLGDFGLCDVKSDANIFGLIRLKAHKVPSLGAEAVSSQYALSQKYTMDVSSVSNIND